MSGVGKLQQEGAPHTTWHTDGPLEETGHGLVQGGRGAFHMICDYFSKYPIVTPLHATTSENVTEEIRKAVSLFGRPDEIVSDNGPQYIRKPFQDFVHKWGIQHTTSSPRFPQSNGFIERQVQTIKKIIKKCKKEKQSLHLAMLNLRVTPVDSKLPSPAEMLMGRPITTLLPSRTSPSPVTVAQRQHLDRRQSTMKSNYDRHAGESLPPLHKGQRQDPGQSKQDLDTWWSHRTQQRTTVLQRQNKPGVHYPTQQRRLEGSSPAGLCRHWKPAWCDKPDSSSASPTGNSLCHLFRARSYYWSWGWTTFAVWPRDH